MSRFGDIISADRLEADVEKFLQKWIKTYLGEMAEQNGEVRTAYPKPAYWTTTPILTHDSVSQVRYPAVLIVAPGLVSKPIRRGSEYEGTYQVGICVLTSAGTEKNTAKAARRYGAATRTAILQKPGMETDYIEGVEWVDERFTDFLNANQETVASATEIFNITCGGMFDAMAGPPPGSPPLDEPATAPNPEYEEQPSVADPDDPGNPYSPIPPSVTPLD